MNFSKKVLFIFASCCLLSSYAFAATWEYEVRKLEWAFVENVINQYEPCDVSGIRMLVSQKNASGSYWVHLWVREDHCGTKFKVYLTNWSNGSSAYIKDSLAANDYAPLAFYQSSSSGTSYWFVKQIE